jgi:hypothetical protein
MVRMSSLDGESGRLEHLSRELLPERKTLIFLPEISDTFDYSLVVDI